MGAPTGQAFNTFDPASSDFVITKNGSSGPAFFLFATEDGTIAGWNPSVDRAHAVIAVDRSTATDSAGDVGALYKGLALVSTPAGKFIYASNFRFGTVDVFDSHFDLVNSFTDPTVPAGFAPFGIHNIGGKLFVTFAKQGPGKEDDAARPATDSSTNSPRTATCSSGWSAAAGSTPPGQSRWRRRASAPSAETSSSATSATGGSTSMTRRAASSRASSAGPVAARS